MKAFIGLNIEVETTSGSMKAMAPQGEIIATSGQWVSKYSDGLFKVDGPFETLLPFGLKKIVR